MTMNSYLRQQQQQQQQSPDTSRHINFLWPSVDHVAYPRHNAGLKIPLAGAKYADAITFIDGHMLLKTAAVEQSVPPFKKCSQYEYRGGCERGSQCKYLHPVHIDASLTKRKRHRVLSSANTSQSTVGALDASLTLCETESDHKPVLQLPVLALPAPCVPRRTWWYRDPYSQTKVRIWM